MTWVPKLGYMITNAASLKAGVSQLPVPAPLLISVCINGLTNIQKCYLVVENRLSTTIAKDVTESAMKMGNSGASNKCVSNKYKDN